MEPDLRDLIRSIPDFPKKGIVFRDITTLLKDRLGLRGAVEALTTRYRGEKIDKVVCIEARGFLLGGAVAYQLGSGVVPVRKPGKLPAKKLSQTYELEYGADCVEIHRDALCKGDRVLIVDDLLATGGTARATAELVEALGAELVGCAFLIELRNLNGRKLLDKYDVFSVIAYD